MTFDGRMQDGTLTNCWVIPSFVFPKIDGVLTATMDHKMDCVGVVYSFLNISKKKTTLQ